MFSFFSFKYTILTYKTWSALFGAFMPNDLDQVAFGKISVSKHPFVHNNLMFHQDYNKRSKRANKKTLGRTAVQRFEGSLI